MREIDRSTAFRRDYKRERKGQHGRALAARFDSILASLLNDAPLPEACRDHALSGQWLGYRDCHIWPDLVLIYRKPDAYTLHLARLGSHAELFE